MTTLLLTSRNKPDDQLLWRAAIARGWNVERVNGIRLPMIDDPNVVIYVEAFYAPEVARQLGIQLFDPPENWLAVVPREYTQRQIELITLSESRNRTFPVFVKPPNDKSFKARVYESADELPSGFDEQMNVLVATPIQFGHEFRCFALNGKVLTVSPYKRGERLAEEFDFEATHDELDSASKFAERVLSDSRVPKLPAIALDVGTLSDGTWAVVEANGAWGSGIYGCDPDAVLTVLQNTVSKK